MFVGEQKLIVAGHGGRKTDRAVRRKMELRLPFKFRPLWINESDLHTIPFLPSYVGISVPTPIHRGLFPQELGPLPGHRGPTRPDRVPAV